MNTRESVETIKVSVGNVKPLDNGKFGVTFIYTEDTSFPRNKVLNPRRSTLLYNRESYQEVGREDIDKIYQMAAEEQEFLREHFLRGIAAEKIKAEAEEVLYTYNKAKAMRELYERALAGNLYGRDAQGKFTKITV